MLESLSISDLLGFTSIGCWLGAQFPQVIENIRLQSCEGLALPFLANWLLGDISNLIGCLLTHQLPFQTWLATYFVIVDCMLVAQYMYYYKAPKSVPSMHPHVRSATTPGRRMSVDRGASRYRALSTVASNVAAAAALAAQQDEQERPARYPYRSRRGSRPEASGSLVRDGMYEEEEGDLPSAMFDSFHSEGGRDLPPKRISWSIERHGARAASVGRVRPPAPTALNLISNDTLTSIRSSETLLGEVSSRRETLDSAEATSPIVSTRGTKASRKGSTMVFLGAWALFGIGALASSHRSLPSSRMTNIGRVLTGTYLQNSFPIVAPDAALIPRDVGLEEFEDVELDFPGVSANVHPDDPPPEYPHPEEPSSEQVLGRIFAWLCTTLYLTSRLPQIWKNYVRKSVEGLSMYLFVFAFLGNTFYVASILVSPRRYLPPPESAKYIRESIPYLLGSGGTLLFDITIVSQSFCYRPRRRHATASYVRVPDEEEAGLLSADPVSAHLSGDSAIMNRGRTSRTRSVA